MTIKEVKEWNKYFKYSKEKPNSETLDTFLKNATEEEKIKRELETVSFGKINPANLDTCMTYGLAGMCGEQCPWFESKKCPEVEEMK